MIAQPYHQHLGDSSDLITPHDEVRAGFLALALERNRRATPAVKAAQHLKALASRATSPLDLLTMPDIQPALLTAAGVSDKAGAHLSSDDKVAAIQAFIEQYLEPAGRGFVEELVFRYLLTRGDALGGSMRNVGGLLAHRRFTRAVLAALQVAERPYVTLDGMDRSWMTGISNDADIENHCKAISWTTRGQPRTLVYNVKVPFVGNNVDACLLSCPSSLLSSVGYKTPNLFIALGELKGGVDPAGFDEHWKTARTALSRIREAFARQSLSPQMFFVATGIAPNMAKEIWSDLENGLLSNAANLTNSRQVSLFTQWLITL